MEIIIVVVIAAALGSILMLTPLVDTRRIGVLVVPTSAVVVTGFIWTGLLWLGATPESPLMWVVPLLVGTVAAAIIGVLLGRRRTSVAEARFQQLLRLS